jgi:hypothetical protein
MKFICLIGKHLWGPVTEAFINGQVQLALRCIHCGTIKAWK